MICGTCRSFSIDYCNNWNDEVNEHSSACNLYELERRKADDLCRVCRTHEYGYDCEGECSIFKED